MTQYIYQITTKKRQFEAMASANELNLRFLWEKGSKI